MISLETQNGNKHSNKWYVIRAEPQADFLAASELLRAGFEIFSPRIMSQQTTSNSQYAPLFPGYLFLKWDLEGAGKPSFDRAPHVSGWVNFEGEYPSVPDDLVKDLATRVENINAAGGMWRRFKTGDKVRVLSGKFECLGEVVEPSTSANSKVRIIMEFMGRLISAQVPGNNLRPLESYPDEKIRVPRRTRGRGRPIGNFKPTLVRSG